MATNFVSRYRKIVQKEFCFHYIIFLIIEQFNFSAEEFADTALSYPYYASFYRMMKNRSIPRKCNYSAKKIADYIVYNEKVDILERVSKETIAKFCNELSTLDKGNTLTKKQKGELEDACREVCLSRSDADFKKALYVFFELLISMAYKAPETTDSRNSSRCLECTKMLNISSRFHRFAHKLRDEYYLLPFLVQQDDIHPNDKINILNEMLLDYLDKYTEIIREETCFDTLTVLEVLLNRKGSNNGDKMTYEVDNLSILPFCYSPKTFDYKKKIVPLASSPEHLEIAQKNVIDYGPGNNKEFDRILIPIRVYSLIAPSNMVYKDNVKSKGLNYTYTEIKEKMNNPDEEHKYDIRGFLYVKIFGKTTEDKYNYCREITNAFCDFLYKYIERINYYKIL